MRMSDRRGRKMEKYTKEWYKSFCGKSKESADYIVPIIMDLFAPKSVVDLGCGVGTWLRAFKENGAAKVTGYDGDYVEKSQLYIDETEFIPYDLNKRIDTNEKYDLAMSVEVAEHIERENAKQFVENLTNLSNIIVFSAAIPNQGGRNHINEQWPAYWQEIFASYGYSAFDCIRNIIWDNEDIRYWYAQNIMIYITDDIKSIYIDKMKELAGNVEHVRSLVHPVLYQYRIDELQRKEETIEYTKWKYLICAKWLENEIEHKDIVEFLKKNGLNKIAIYGKGVITNLLQNKLEGQVIITSVIDKKECEQEELNLDNIDGVLLTVPRKMIANINHLLTVRCITIEEVIGVEDEV